MENLNELFGQLNIINITISNNNPLLPSTNSRNSPLGRLTAVDPVSNVNLDTTQLSLSISLPALPCDQNAKTTTRSSSADS